MILLDTNVLARSIQNGHVHQQAAIDAVAEIRRKANDVPVVFPQTLIEFYAISTRAQNNLGLSADQAFAEIEHIKREFPLIAESTAIFAQWEKLTQKYKPVNRRVYDLRLAACMIVNNIPRILSFNDQDFIQYTEIQVLNPFDVLNIPRVK